MLTYLAHPYQNLMTGDGNNQGWAESYPHRFQIQQQPGIGNNLIQ